MVVLNKIYTRTGDAGETALGNGARVAKFALRVETYGTSDELNSCVGVARLEATGDIDGALERIQNDLFDLGADMCTPDMDKDGEREYPPLRMAAEQVTRLESEIDAMNAELQPLNSFILPGGKPTAAQLHLARTVARRAEREITRAAELEPIGAEAVKYINRLSDHLFVLARWINDRGATDVLWVPGANR
jgi:cob(I)alamin adenosyltransferase